MNTRLVPPSRRSLVRRFLGALALTLLLLAPGVSAFAATSAPLTKIFVASYGNDANDGTRGAPKRNFQAAHNAVAAGGSVVALDTAGYGQLNITKSITVTCPPGVNAFVTVTGGVSAIYVNAAATDTVVLRGLIIEGSNTAESTAIYSTKVGLLRVEDTKIRNLRNGIFLVNAVSDAQLTIHRCDIGEVLYAVTLQGAMSFNTYGAMTDSTVDDVSYGLIAGTNCNFTVRHCVFTKCSIGALDALSYGFLYVATSTFAHNGNTVYQDPSDYGTALTYGDNMVADLSTPSKFYATKVPFQ